MKQTSWLSGLSHVRSPEPLGVRAHVALVHRTDRQEQHRQLVLVQVAEHVALVLLVVGAAHQVVATVARHDLGVVTGRHGVEAETVARARRAGRT